MVGYGGCACVVRGEYGNQPVAVKILPPDMLTHTAVRLLEEEAHILSLVNKLRHPNILRFMGAWFSYGTHRLIAQSPIMVTELLDMDLRQLYERTHIQRCNMLGIFMDVAYGLCYLHRHLIIHRDINPSNIFLRTLPADSGERSGAWRAKIGDFGTASLSSVGPAPLGGGTPIFSAPETLPSTHTRPHSVSTRITVQADMYSYGVLLVEVAMGVVPEDDESYLRLVKGLQRKWSSLHWVVEQCTQLEARRRPTASRVVDALEYRVAPSLEKT